MTEMIVSEDTSIYFLINFTLNFFCKYLENLFFFSLYIFYI